MNVTLIEEPPAQARRRLKAYRAAIHRKADAEYVATEKAYRELANGRPLLNLADAFRLAPLDPVGRPGLAIGRADQTQVMLSAGQPGRIRFDTRYRWGDRPGRMTMVDVPLPERRGMQGYALIPMVPPEIKKHHAIMQGRAQ